MANVRSEKKIDDVVENYKFVSPESIEEAVQVGRLHQTVFALGCFWGPDANLGGIPGVVQTRVGYAGSSTLDPSYDDIQGHAEVVRVVFDNELISYRDLLGDFQTWFVPGESQGQYRPILFVFNKEQKLIAEELVLSIGKKNSPEVIEAGTQKGYFWDAEDYHQKYRLRRNNRFVSLASKATLENRLYIVTKTTSNCGQIIKFFAEEAGGRDYVSLNVYKAGDRIYIRPCEQPISKSQIFLQNADFLIKQ